MHARRPPARHDEQVAVEFFATAHTPVPLDGADLCSLDPEPPVCAADAGRRPHRDAGVQRRHYLGPGRLRTKIADRRDGHAGLVQVERGGVGGIVGGHHHRARSHLHAVAVEVSPCRVGQHDARPVVLREHQRPFDSARGEHHFLCSHLPQPFARQLRVRIGEMVGDALGKPEKIVGVVAEGGRP